MLSTRKLNTLDELSRPARPTTCVPPARRSGPPAPRVKTAGPQTPSGAITGKSFLVKFVTVLVFALIVLIPLDGDLIKGPYMWAAALLGAAAVSAIAAMLPTRSDDPGVAHQAAPVDTPAEDAMLEDDDDFWMADGYGILEFNGARPLSGYGSDEYYGYCDRFLDSFDDGYNNDDSYGP